MNGSVSVDSLIWVPVSVSLATLEPVIVVPAILPPVTVALARFEPVIVVPAILAPVTLASASEGLRVRAGQNAAGGRAAELRVAARRAGRARQPRRAGVALGAGVALRPGEARRPGEAGGPLGPGLAPADLRLAALALRARRDPHDARVLRHAPDDRLLRRGRADRPRAAPERQKNGECRHDICVPRFTAHQDPRNPSIVPKRS